MVDEQTNKEVNLVELAQLNAERLEKANEVYKELLKKQEAIETRRILGGQSNSVPQDVKPVEESPKDYVKKVMSGQL